MFNIYVYIFSVKYINWIPGLQRTSVVVCHFVNNLLTFSSKLYGTSKSVWKAKEQQHPQTVCFDTDCIFIVLFIQEERHELLMGVRGMCPPPTPTPHMQTTLLLITSPRTLLPVAFED
jgi:hypothetical protein